MCWPFLSVCIVLCPHVCISAVCLLLGGLSLCSVSFSYLAIYLALFYVFFFLNILFHFSTVLSSVFLLIFFVCVYVVSCLSSTSFLFILPVFSMEESAYLLFVHYTHMGRIGKHSGQ